MADISPEDQAAIDAVDNLPPSAGQASAPPPPGGGISKEDQAAIDSVDALPPSGAGPVAGGDTPPPTRHLGPPRLHAQANQPRPPPSAGGGPPAPAVPPAPSWEQLPGLMVKNFLPSVGRQIGNTIEALKPQNIPKDISAINDLGYGALSHLGIYDQGASDAEKKKNRAQFDAMVAAKKAQWGFGPEGMAGLRRTWGYDPASPLMDVATGASLVGGPAALAARAPGLIGETAAEAAGQVARVAGGVEAATNPITLPFRAVGLAAGAPGAVIRAVRGAPEAADVAGEAADPVSALRAVHDDEKIPTEMVDPSQAAPPEAATEVARVRQNWRNHAANAATDLTGSGDGPDPAALGAALERRQLATHNTGMDNFDAVGNHTGQFAPSFAPTLRGAVDTAFKNADLPPVTGPGNISTLPGTFGKTQEMMNWLHGHIDDLAANNALTPSNLMRARQEIGTAFSGATGKDRLGLGTLQQALDDHITNMADAGAYSGGNGPAVANSMRHAVDYWRNYQANFGSNSPIGNAVNLLRRGQVLNKAGRLTPSVAGTTEAVTANLGKGLINPTNLSVPATAPLLYSHLQNVLGGEGSEGAQALNNYVRQSVTRTNPVGEQQSVLAAKPANIQRFRQSGLSKNVFNDADHKQLGNIAETERMATTRPKSGTRDKNFLGSLVSAGSRHAAGALLGSAFGHAGAFIGEQMVQHVFDPILAARTAAKAFKPMRRGVRPPSVVTPGRAARLANLAWQATPQSAQEQQKEAEQNDQAIAAAAPRIADVAKSADMGRAPAATPTDIDAVVRMAAAEGDPTPQGWQAVAAVMRNRSLQGGLSLADLAAEPHQFTAYGNKNYMDVRPGSARYEEILNAIEPVLAGKVDPTGGADSYYAPALLNHPPKWDDGSGQMIGTQRFFRGKYHRHPDLQVARGYAQGGQVTDLVERLMQRAEQSGKATRTATKPLLTLPDDVVTKALAVAGRSI